MVESSNIEETDIKYAFVYYVYVFSLIMVNQNNHNISLQ